jgi:hypothetical protein
MKTKQTSEKTGNFGGISSDAVKKATGKGWSDWIKILDKEGGKNMTHKEIAQRVYDKYEISGWWSQMVTVGYEQAAGKRIKHQVKDGFQISVSKTFDVTVSKLYNYFAKPALRNKWLSEDVSIRTQTQNKSMRLNWNDGKTILSVNFYPKSDKKSQVVIQHEKLPTKTAAEKMKKLWKGKLETLLS